VTEFFVEETASVEYDIKQNEDSLSAYHINQTFVKQQRNSTFDICTVTIGGKLVRNNLNIVLNDVNCTAHLYGLAIATGQEIIDNHTLVDHASPLCQSNELYKNILNGSAHGVFNGKIFVRKDAQKTNAFQSNKNILLSKDAVMNAKPQLEIYADDVKCSHGATTGQLDEDALFYLRSRGINENDARALLNFAFASDVIEKINNESLRRNLLKLLSQKLGSHIEFDLD
jgi:Fe-S cluster assembly protein SufD